MNLILIEPGELDGESRVRLEGARGRHVLDVLKATPGKSIRVGLVNGSRGRAVVEKTEKNVVQLKCEFDADSPPRPRTDLLLALPRPKIMRRLWAQLSAIGVGNIILTNAEKVERNYFDTHVLEPETYRPLLIEGLQQAQDTRLPEVSIHKQFRKLVEDELDQISDASVRLLADPGSGKKISDVITPENSARILLAVGPEGGWNEFEKNQLTARGFQTISMGPRTLRTDTACIALLAQVMPFG